MHLPLATGLITALLVSGCAVAQAPDAPQDHSAHHPAGIAPAAPTPAPGSTADAFNRQMKAMQEMHQKMQAARSPAERAALMDEHMKTMQSGMAMMGQMRGAGAATGMGAAGMGSMMDMHTQMERRMAMMEQMMKMMLDREAAMPRK